MRPRSLAAMAFALVVLTAAALLGTQLMKHVEEFTASAQGVTYRLAIESLEAPGVLGFFFRTFGKRSTGSAFLTSHKEYLEGRAAGGG